MKIKIIDSEKEERNASIYIDDVYVGYCYTRFSGTETISLYVDKEGVELIESFKLQEIDKKIDSLKFDFWHQLDDFDLIDNFGYQIIFNEKAAYSTNIFPCAIISIQVDTEKWNKPYSISDLSEKIKSYCRINKNIGFYQEDDEFINNGFGIICGINDINESIENLNYQVYTIFHELLNDCNKQLIEEFKPNSLTAIFKFPEEIKISCVQYLMYFSKFLEDIGIQSESSIREQAKNVLFEVSPKDTSNALSYIRDALNLYLLLIEYPNIEIVASSYNDVGVKQLLDNIHFLKSQILLSNQVNANGLTIQNLNLINYELKDIQSKNKPDNDKVEEALIPGIINIKKYENSVISINLPEILRMIKRKLKKNH